MGNEHLGERWFLMDHPDNSRPLYSGDDRLHHGRDGRYTQRLPSKTSLAEEFVRSKNGGYCFLPLLRNDGDFYFAPLDVEGRVTSVPL
jgi:hypothetical protein